MKPKMQSLKLFYDNIDIKMPISRANWLLYLSIFLLVFSAILSVQNSELRKRVVELRKRADLTMEISDLITRVDSIQRHLIWMTNNCRYEKSKQMIREIE